MIMINGNWEQVKDLSDVLRIVSENISYEFAKKVEEIFNAQITDTNEKINDLFIEVLDLTGDLIDDDAYKQYIGKFNFLVKGKL